MGVRRGALVLSAAFGACAIASGARADERVPYGSEADRPYTLAQLGVGLLTLPAADVCLRGRACTKGDNSIELDFWQLYRANHFFAVGAGASVALTPVT